uniref:NADH-ubiquinone oxidoreductase chain 6 n=1 Tax=Leucocryptos marina TaxID=299206 RepID=I4DEZ8_LEUMA|nr:NADH dehydrogenase subunit 6 [Leucocryptos marina]
MTFSYAIIVLYSLLLSCALFVVLTMNTVYAVFFLIFAFFTASAVLLYLGFEFLAMVFLIVYVGAIAVLFLFVVMMLNVRYIPWLKKDLRFAPLGFLILAFFLLLFLFAILHIESDIYWSLNIPYSFLSANLESAHSQISSAENTEMLGTLLFTHYWVSFFSSRLCSFYCNGRCDCINTTSYTLTIKKARCLCSSDTAFIDSSLIG